MEAKRGEGEYVDGGEKRGRKKQKGREGRREEERKEVGERNGRDGRWHACMSGAGENRGERDLGKAGDGEEDDKRGR